jgi:hypothetical protein
MRKTAGYTWADHRTKQIAKELNVTPVLHKIQECRINWLQQTNKQTE